MAVSVASSVCSRRNPTEHVDDPGSVFLRRGLLAREVDKHGVGDNLAPAEAENLLHAAVCNSCLEGEDRDSVADVRDAIAQLGEALGEGAEGFAMELAHPEQILLRGDAYRCPRNATAWPG